MPLTLDQAHQIIIDAIENDTTHPNYKRVNALADFYMNLITGEGLENLLHQFALREDDASFQQRLELTISTTDALTSSLMNPFEKVLRTDPLVKRIESKDEKAIEVLTDKLMEFFHSENQNSGLDYWFQTRFKSLSFTDPNAFIVLEWDAFDGNYEKASPYPYEVSSAQAINFSYRNNKLEFLLDKRPNVYEDLDLKKSGYKFTLYLVGYVLVYEQVGKRYIPETNEAIYQSKGDTRYAIRLHETKLDSIPAISIGYIEDDLTKGVTYINPFHVARSWFMKVIRLISEADLSKTLHAFPQKFQYVQPCLGDTAGGCISGRTRDGDVCGTCKGTGYVFHQSAQDAVILPLPRNKEDMLNLDNLMVYKHPPIDLLKFQEDIIDKYEGKIHAAVFNTQAMVKKTTVATATERDQEMDSVYDTLHPFAEKVTAAWSAIVSLISEITETNPADLVVDMRYPNDFKLKSFAQLIADLKTANESNAPSFVRAKLNADIAEQTFVDQPEEFNKYQVKQRFYPFSGKTMDEVNFLMGMDYTPFRTKVLYANFDMLFKRAEKENTGFWMFKQDKQEAILDQYLDELEQQLKPKQVEFNPMV